MLLASEFHLGPAWSSVGTNAVIQLTTHSGHCCFDQRTVSFRDAAVSA